MNEIKEMQIVLTKMIDLLNAGGHPGWGENLKILSNDLNDDPNETKRKILSLFGGMGSLNDIVLYRDGKMLSIENDEFSNLSSKLYTICKIRT